MRSQAQNERKVLGQRLKAALRETGLKGVDVARDLGVAENTVSQWFQGKREPKLEILKIFLQKYGVNPIFILTGEGPPLLDRPSSLPLDMRKKKHLRRRGSFVNRISNFACC